MSFHPDSIWWLLALAFLPVIWWRWLARQPHSAVRFSSIKPLQFQGAGWAVRGRHLLPLLRTLSIGLLVVCLARPRKGNEQTQIYAEGIAIQMVVDLSGSMQGDDFVIDRQRATRLDAVKSVFQEFVEGDGDQLAGRPDDLIGLIGFARHADSLAPLTLDHDNVLSILSELETTAGPTMQRRMNQLEQAHHRARAAGDQRRMEQIALEYERLKEEGVTAIGDALALGVERLRDLDRRRLRRSEANQIKSKIIILLTDGENNAGDFAPEQAAALAKASEIKIYTIGIGSARRGGALVNEKQMRDVAETTGGKFFKATHTQGLGKVYAAIDELEKTKTEERHYLDYKPAATGWLSIGDFRTPPWLMVVLGLLGLEILLANTRLKRLP